jgi:hypothetical protein
VGTKMATTQKTAVFIVYPLSSWAWHFYDEVFCQYYEC